LKIDKRFYSAVKFAIFGHQNLGSVTAVTKNAGSGFAIKLMRIQNTAAKKKERVKNINER
jgi:hypothetical protein